MLNERGGPLTGFLVSIGAIVVFFGLLAVACGACTTDKKQHSLGAMQLISHHHHHGDDDRYRDGDGNGNSGGDYEGGKSGDNDQRGDHNCRNFCFYGIPQPGGGGQQPAGFEKLQGFIPPNPGKIPQQVADFIKLVADFVQSVIKFAV